MTTKDLRFRFDDGGRSRYFVTQATADNVPRAIAIASGRDYRAVYDELTEVNGGETPRGGIPKKKIRNYIETQLGGVWHPRMDIGKPTKRLTASDIPRNGRVIVRCPKCLVAVIDGVIRDTIDHREQPPAVFGFWILPRNARNGAQGTNEHANEQNATERK